MKGKNLLNVLLVSFLGGALPLAAYLTYQSVSTRVSDRVLDGENFYAHPVGLNGEALPDLTAASETSINSVVHVTTKVVSTTFQRDLFQEFFYGPALEAKNLSNMDPEQALVLLYLRRATLSQTTMLSKMRLKSM